MIRYAPKRLYAALLLLVLLAAYAGQKVHIYNEDHAHFSAHCGDLVPDNGAHTIIVDRCIIDDFYFFPYLDIAPTVHSFYAEMLAVLLPCRVTGDPLHFPDSYSGCMQPGPYYLLSDKQ